MSGTRQDLPGDIALRELRAQRPRKFDKILKNALDPKVIEEVAHMRNSLNERQKRAPETNKQLAKQSSVRYKLGRNNSVQRSV